MSWRRQGGKRLGETNLRWNGVYFGLLAGFVYLVWEVNWPDLGIYHKRQHQTLCGLLISFWAFTEYSPIAKGVTDCQIWLILNTYKGVQNFRVPVRTTATQKPWKPLYRRLICLEGTFERAPLLGSLGFCLGAFIPFNRGTLCPASLFPPYMQPEVI